MKRILELQLKEREDKIRLKKFEEVTEAKFVKHDVEDFNHTIEEKKKKVEGEIQVHTKRLV